MALVAYNLLSVVRAAFQAVHGEEAARWLSVYYMANEVSRISDGMSVILDGDFWKKKFANLTPTQMANELKRLARNIELTKYEKAKWTPKKKKKKKEQTEPPNHVSTARVLQEAKQAAAGVA
jgi:hypothetical protein